LYLATRERVGAGAELGRALDQEMPEQVRLEKARLEELDLSWIALREARLEGADLRGARLDRAVASDATFDGAVLDGASFEQADLRDASMVDASIAQVTWEGVKDEGLVDLHAEPERRDAAPWPERPRPILHGALSGLFNDPLQRGGGPLLAWSVDGRRLVSGHEDGSVCFWDARSGRLRHVQRHRTGAVLAVTFSPDGEVVASAGEDGTVRFWNAEDGVALMVRLGEAVLIPDTPFFSGVDPDAAPLHYVSGARVMPARLWAPLFEREDLVRASAEGRCPDLAALGLDSFSACAAALFVERKRRGLIRRRSVTVASDRAVDGNAREPERRASMTESTAEEVKEAGRAPTAPAHAPRLHRAAGRRTFLTVATEWFSAHGGLSTFSRELCLALARAGQDVYCYVPSASEAEREHSERHGVKLLVAPPGAGEEMVRLHRRPRLTDGVVPDVIIGHGRVTGTVARRLAEDDFPGSKRVHFVHVAPGQIEWFKEQSVARGAAETADARE
ncbi:MAG TPA: pentapeptide repeat-containing protein, partial [Myxococcaceae bacterium]|nr:pentapeptide repeat-containing protein [Myxococcaceae bacterium]